MESINNRLLNGTHSSLFGAAHEVGQVPQPNSEISFSSLLEKTLGKLNARTASEEDASATDPARLSIEPPQAQPAGVDEFDGLAQARGGQEEEPLREAFQNFVGQTFFSQMITSLRSTQEGSKYFNGGQAEKIFQGQLDQLLSEEITKASASQISDPMFRLFQLQRSK